MGESSDQQAVSAAAAADGGAAARHFDEGVALMGRGDGAGAVAALRRALAAVPALVEAHINLGLLLAGSGASARDPWTDPAAAEAHYRQAIGLDPLRLEGHLHLGALLVAQKRFAEGEACYRLALALEPQSPAALSNLGVLLASCGREAEAAACYRAALAAAPDYQNAHFNLACLLLRQGDFAAGWRAFEGRPWYARLDAYFACPRWEGQALAGKSLMIGIEAGHGDMIQFCRYAALARAAGAARIGIVCHDGLKRLFASLAAVDQVFGYSDAVPRSGWDYWVPPMSMPYRFGTRLDSIPGGPPYLFADPVDSARIAARMAAAAQAAAPVAPASARPLLVGLAWQGNPRFDNDGDRSLASLAVLAPLADVAGVHFFSLQKGPGALGEGAGQGAGATPTGAAPVSTTTPGFAGAPLTDLAPWLDDFADTAAALVQLDLVIAVDTAVAHLAGAVGTPCYLLLPAYRPDWRWLSDRSDTPWYPRGMRLFRQQQAGDWRSVVTQLRQALAELARGRR